MQFENKKQMIFSAASTTSTWTPFSTCNTLTQFFFDYGPWFIFLFASKPTANRTMFVEHRQIDRSHSPEETCEKCAQFNVRKEWISRIWKRKSTTTAQVKRRKIIKIAHYIMERTLRETKEVHVFKMIAIRQCRAFECFVYNTFFLFAYAKQNAISKCDYLFAWIFVDALLLCLFIASDSIR